ncbi:MAG: hypothetical protein R3D66_04375 [Alphaproteobacteria bacterium]
MKTDQNLSEALFVAVQGKNGEPATDALGHILMTSPDFSELVSIMGKNALDPKRHADILARIAAEDTAYEERWAAEP